MFPACCREYIMFIAAKKKKKRLFKSSVCSPRFAKPDFFGREILNILMKAGWLLCKCRGKKCYFIVFFCSL